MKRKHDELEGTDVDEEDVVVDETENILSEVWNEVTHDFLKKLCREPDCTSLAARGGKKGLCIGHGGGRRCQSPNCGKCAVSGGIKGFCKTHGGGTRCKFPNCKSGAETGGLKGFCVCHGGGKRCVIPDCPKSSVSGGLKGHCYAHGGGRRCLAPKCLSFAKYGGKSYCLKHATSVLPVDGSLNETNPNNLSRAAKVGNMDSDIIKKLIERQLAAPVRPQAKG